MALKNCMINIKSATHFVCFSVSSGVSMEHKNQKNHWKGSDFIGTTRVLEDVQKPQICLQNLGSSRNVVNSAARIVISYVVKREMDTARRQHVQETRHNVALETRIICLDMQGRSGQACDTRTDWLARVCVCLDDPS